jgi:hypothetical protein
MNRSYLIAADICCLHGCKEKTKHREDAYPRISIMFDA